MAVFDQRVRKDFGEDIGWAPVGILFPLILVAIVYPIATAGYLAPPALVGSTLALLYVATSGSTIAACLCGASFAFAAELHPVTLLGAPLFVLMVSMSCDRPIRALSGGIASGVAAALVMSFNAWVQNARSLLQEPALLALATGALAIALLISSWARPKWLALDVERRRLLLLALLVIVVTAELLVASVVIRRMLLMPHYFLIGLPALAILAAIGLRRLRRRDGWRRLVAQALPVVLLCAPLTVAAAWRVGLSTGTVSVPNYSMREAQILANHLWARGYTFPDVQRHLRGPQSLELMGALAVFAPNPDGPLDRPQEDLRVLAFSEPNRPGKAVPAGGEELDLGCGRHAWVLPIDPWVRIAPSRVCFEEEPNAATEPDCVDIESPSIAYTGRFRDLNERAFPALGNVRDRIDGRSAQSFTWELSIELTGDDRERHIDIVGVIAPPWRIERVEGVAYRGELPARHVVLERGGGLSGRLALVAADGPMTRKPYPPDFLETRPGEETLRVAIRKLPPLGRLLCQSHGTCPD